MNSDTGAGVHWSFWVLGAIGLLFNVMGCINFLSQTSAESVDGMPEAYRAIVESRPAWATAAFAVAVLGGAIGALMLLLRKSSAHYVFIASLLGAVAAQVPLLGMSDFPIGVLVGGLMQVVVSAFLAWYARWADRKGWIGLTRA